jgi:hypothetical protein
MISWATIFYGAALSAAFAVGAAFLLARERDRLTLAVVLVAALAGPIAWNAVLHSREASDFFVDAPVAVFPVSWQDVGSGVWALAAASLVLGATQDRAHRTLALSLLTAAAALLVDIYLY